jgi:nitrogen fixation protein FixH
MSSMAHSIKPGAGKRVFIYFLAFFGTIVAVDSAFVYTAIHTNTGEVMEQPYEKGLAYNQTLDQAQAQPDLKESIQYADGIFRWSLSHADGTPLRHAGVRATFIRPVMQGHDFSVDLVETTAGIYEAKQAFPLQGLWTAKLSAQWNGKQYKTTHDFMTR